MDISRVVIEGGERAGYPAQHRHRMGVAPKAAVEGAELLVHHRVVGDVVEELLSLLGGRQLAEQEQIRHLHEIAFLGQLLNRIAAVEQYALVAVDIGDAGAAGGGRHEAGIVGEVSGLPVQLADIDDFGADRAFEHRQLDRLAGGVVDQRHRAAGLGDVAVVAVHRCTSVAWPAGGGRIAAPRIGCPRPIIKRRSNFATQYRRCEMPYFWAGSAAASAIRPRHSSRPKTSITSKMPGEAVVPVKAARNGCATAPSLTPFAVAKSRSRCSSGAPSHSASARSCSSASSNRRASPVNSLAASG